MCCTQYASRFGKFSSGHSTGKASFHSNPKEGQCQRMLKLPQNCTHFTCQQGNAQNLPSQTLIVHEPRTSRCTRWVQKRQKNQRSNRQHCWSWRKQGSFRKNIYFSFIDYAKAFDCVDHNKLWKILKDMGIYLLQISSREFCKVKEKS